MLLRRLEGKRTKLDSDGRFKETLKDAYKGKKQKEKRKVVQSICSRLILEYDLVGQKLLQQSTVYQAAQNGVDGTSTKKRRVPAPKILMVLLQVAATYSHVCQSRDGDLLKSKGIAY